MAQRDGEAGNYVLHVALAEFGVSYINVYVEDKDIQSPSERMLVLRYKVMKETTKTIVDEGGETMVVPLHESELKMNAGIRFPRLSHHFVWSSCNIEAPLRGDLQAGSYETFLIRVPDASAVAVGAEWEEDLLSHQFLRYDCDKELYFGKIKVPTGACKVIAVYENSAPKLLLEYEPYE